MDDLTEILKKRLGPGILIFDLYERLLFTSPEALALVPELVLSGIDWSETEHPVLACIQGACTQMKENLKEKKGNSGGLYYCPTSKDGTSLMLSIRAIPIGVRGDAGHDHIMVLLEKVTATRAVDLVEAKQKFNLTSREAELLGYLTRGHTNKTIADTMFISEHTVKDHIKNIMKKIGVKHRGEIIAALM